MYKRQRYRPEDIHTSKRDYFVLSKGHAAPALYSALARAGYFPLEELYNLRQINSIIQGHPSPETPGVSIATGSLGQGLSVGNGIALGIKQDNLESRVYVLLGDGEIQQGQVWEAAMTSAHYNLDNLCAIIDNNELQIDGAVKDVMNIEPIKDKFKSFGWHVINVDGHDFNKLRNAFAEAWYVRRKPTVIIAHTTKGRGVHFMEGDPGYHGKCITPEQLEKALPDIQERLRLLYAKRPGIREIIETNYGGQLKPRRKQLRKLTPSAFSNKKWEPTRNAYGRKLAEVGALYPDIVVLDADLSESTKSIEFCKRFPKRFINVGIAEQDLVSTGFGFCVQGKIPFINSFSAFLITRGYDQIRLGAYSNKKLSSDINAVLVGSHSGIQPGEDGPTHHAIEDIALMSVIPDITIVVPADSIEAEQIVESIAKYKHLYNELKKEFRDEKFLEEVIKTKKLPNGNTTYKGESLEEIIKYKGIIYVRNCRCPVPVILDDYPDYKFKLGRGFIMTQGKDATIIASGTMVHIALEAHNLLKKKGICTSVVNMSTIKPLDYELIKKISKETDLIVTAEDHSIIGGLGSAVENCLSKNNLYRGFLKLKKIGVQDTFTESGSWQELYRKYGLSPDSICKVIEENK